jgi:hypothetical protein
MREITLNILDPEEIARLKAVLNEVVLALPRQKRNCKLLSQSSFLSSPRMVRRIQ